MGVAIIVLSFILGMSWFISDRGQLKLEEEIVVRKVTEKMLASELGSAQARSAEDALKYTDLEEHLEDEQQKLQKEIEAKQTEKDVALSANKEIEDKLMGAEARLRADEPVFENDNIVRKIKGARIALARARRSPAAGEGTAKRLDTRIRNVERMLRETERVLEDAKDNRLATELLISQENITALASLAGDTNWAQRVLENERKDAKLSMENFQDQLRSKNQRELKRQVVNLEERFISFKDSKRAMEERWSDAMTALVKMDHTARSIEAGLMESLEQSAEYESAGGAPIESLAMLRADMEILKLAREDVRKVMDDMKAGIERSVESESEMMMAETAQVSDTLNRLILEARFRGMDEPPEEYAGLIRALNIEDGVDDPALLDKKLADLNILTNYLLEASGRRKVAGAGPGFRTPDSEFDEYLASKLDFDIYVVEEGDTLWGIASKERIYGDPYMWPLLYKYNAARLDDPNIIEPRLKLVVRKQPVGGEVEEARERARTTSGLMEYRLYNRRWLEELCRP